MGIVTGMLTCMRAQSKQKYFWYYADLQSFFSEQSDWSKLQILTVF